MKEYIKPGIKLNHLAGVGSLLEAPSPRSNQQ